MHLTIVGGCFPVQHNIAPARRYHHTLRQWLAGTAPPAQWPGLTIIRYERLSTCLAKIAAAHTQRPGQVLLFHLRAEPVMRLSKLYYRYLDDRGRVRHALRLPGTGPGPAEHHDLLTPPAPAGPVAATPLPLPPRTHRQLRQLNLRLGRWLGHERRARQQYTALVLGVADFCSRHGIRLLLIGPVSRPCSPAENQLSERLHQHFVAVAARHGLDYLPALGEVDAAGQPLFFANGIHVSPAGHDRMAALLHNKLAAAQ